MTEDRFVKVEMDREIHPNGAENEIERLTFEAFDTAYAILREYAVKIVLQGLRDKIDAGEGLSLPSDEQIFEGMPGLREGENPYLALAPNPEEARLSLITAFGQLIIEAQKLSDRGMRVAQADIALEKQFNFGLEDFLNDLTKGDNR